MGFFGKKKEGKENTIQKGEGTTTIDIKVLGSGCKKCNDLEAAVKEALQELRCESTITHVTDFGEIATYGVMSTPALVVNNKVVSYGKVLKKQEVVKLLETM